MEKDPLLDSNTKWSLSLETPQVIHLSETVRLTQHLPVAGLIYKYKFIFIQEGPCSETLEKYLCTQEVQMISNKQVKNVREEQNCMLIFSFAVNVLEYQISIFS